jgi:hypothetical protein
MKCTNCGTQLVAIQKFCPQCGTENGSYAEHVSVSPNTKRTMLVTKVLLGVALITGLLYFAFTLTRNYHPIIADQPSVGYGTTPGQNKIQSRTITARIDRDDIVVDIETVTGSGLIRFFDPEGIQTVPIIAYVTPRGKIVTAMSISESCRSTDFFLQGNTIHCASCPSYWHMESLEAYACCQKYYPDPIASSVERGILRIPLQTVRNWRTRV